jgi:IS6 family transposase
MMRARGLDVDHTTVFRWVQRYAPEINKRIRQHLKMSGTSYRVDETYIKVGKTCKYLYRAVDKEGQTIEFMLSAKRDVSAANRQEEGARVSMLQGLPHSGANLGRH